MLTPKLGWKLKGQIEHRWLKNSYIVQSENTFEDGINDIEKQFELRKKLFSIFAHGFHETFGISR